MKNSGKKIVVITGSRAEYGLLKSTISKLRQIPSLQLVILVTGMHTLPNHGYTLNIVKQDKLAPIHVVPINTEDDMLGWLTQEIVGIRDFCRQKKPHLIMVLGDRDEALAGAIVGAHLNIPVAHIHGGDVTGEVTVDDRIRDAISIFSTVHFPVMKKSAERIQMILGKKNKNICIVGKNGVEEKIPTLMTKKELAIKFGLKWQQPWILFVHHPTPLESLNIREQITIPLQALRSLKKSAEIVAILPNSDEGGKVFIQKMRSSKCFTFITSSLSREIFLSFLACVNVLVGNTSAGVLEAPRFKIPFLHIGRRQEGRRIYKLMKTVNYDVKMIASAILPFLREKKIAQRVPKQPKKTTSLSIRHYLEKYFTTLE